MGHILSAPVELVRVQRHGSSGFRCGVAEMQGWRSAHEDAHEVHCGAKSGAFWVLDGHGGDSAALFCAPKLGEEFADSLDQLPADECIQQGLVKVDMKLREHFKQNPDLKTGSGSTVVGCFAELQNDGTYSLKMANAGDSRGIIVRGIKEEQSTAKPAALRIPRYLEVLAEEPAMVSEGHTCKGSNWPVIQESVDHKPDHPSEKERIVAAGGHVSTGTPPRLDDNLAVSRGLGDFEYKQQEDPALAAEQKVSCVPDIYEVQNLQPGSLCVLCCDGVWDVMSGQDVANLVREELAHGSATSDLGDIAAKIVRTSLDRKSQDNITAMVVQLGSGEDWAEAQPDEIKHWQALKDWSSMDEEVKKQHISFLRRAQFPAEPCLCLCCQKWFGDMHQCPCKEVFYCGKQCQKRGWKAHKSTCPLVAKSSKP